MNFSLISANLQRIRQERGLSQADVAEKAGLSRVGYRNIETGESAPRIDSLLRVAQVLDVRLEELLEPARSLTHVRFRANKKLNSRAELLTRVSRWIQGYVELEGLLDLQPGSAVVKGLADRFSDLPQASSSSESRARARAAAGQARAEFNLGVADPIADVCGLLEHHGVKVFTPVLASDGFFGLSVGPEDGGPAVVVNVWERLSVERWIFTAAHELGHLVLHRNAFNVAETDEHDDEEKDADVFASHFLMPEEGLRAKLEEYRGLNLFGRVLRVKRTFRTSWQSVLYRLAEGKEPSERGRLWGRFLAECKRATGRTPAKTEEVEGLAPHEFSGPAVRSAEPETLSRWDFEEGRLPTLVRSAVEGGLISISKAAQILDVPLEEMRETANAWAEYS